MIKKRNLLKLLIAFLAIPLILVFSAYYSIENNAEHKTYVDASAIPHNKVGLVLGTSKFLNDGRINLYFKYRTEATVELYKKGKIDFVLVSGDNSRDSYDEPTDFKNELIKRGIPENKIYLDYAGFRTLDSVVRAKAIFGQDSITLISQEFHNERGIYLAEHYDIAAIGFNAKEPGGKYGFKTQAREYLARTKAVMDVLFGVEPKFLGDPIKIN